MPELHTTDGQYRERRTQNNPVGKIPPSMLATSHSRARRHGHLDRSGHRLVRLVLVDADVKGADLAAGLVRPDSTMIGAWHRRQPAAVRTAQGVNR
jgi:hypothetical protein